MSLAVPITNSLTFIFSLLTGLCLGEKIGGKGKVYLETLYKKILIAIHKRCLVRNGIGCNRCSHLCQRKINKKNFFLLFTSFILLLLFNEHHRR